MTVYEFAKKLMNDDEFNRGGIIRNERKYLDKVGFEYSVKDGCLCDSGEALSEFYDAMYILYHLQTKQAKGELNKNDKV